ncbi:MAG TPA: site-specific integrase, partial [Christiangramia sp.]|nr:site-specific integrase [Christiangramia sp.]
MNWQNALKDYRHYLKLERGLSINSIENYSLDVIKLMNYLDVNEIQISPVKIQDKTIQEFIYSVSKDLNARS